MPSPAILVDSRLGAEAPGADALGGSMVPIRGEVAMRAMRPAVAGAQSFRGGVVPQPALTPWADGGGPPGRDGDHRAAGLGAEVAQGVLELAANGS